MAKLGLSLYLYTAPTTAGATPFVTQYSDYIENLNFTTVAPGGYGELTTTFKTRDARVPRPEFALFSRVALMDTSNTPLFLGEISDPAIALNESNGESIDLVALGVGNAMRDDPLTIAYAASTVQQIARDQLSRRANYSTPLDADNSMLFPDNPGGTFAPAYTNRTMEEVLSDLAFIAAGAGSTPYDYFVWGHPVNRDAAGFPTGQVNVIKRDTSTIHYQASVAAQEVYEYKITPSSERAYNVVSIDVSNTSGVQTVTYTDSRLAANGGQGTAPFRRRLYKRSLVGSSTITAAVAQNIVNTYGAQFQNATNKIEIKLKAARDANGNPLPLQQLQAGKNIFIPDMTVRGQTLPSVPTAGVNLFYILETRTAFDSSGNLVFSIQCDNYYDVAGAQVARLQLTADSLARVGQTSTARVQALGAPLKGYWGFSADGTIAGNASGPGINYGVTLTQAATSCGYTSSFSNNVASGPFANTFTVWGHNAWVISGGGTVSWGGVWQTAGNCLRRIDSANGVFDWHCDGCQTEHVNLALPPLPGVVPAVGAPLSPVQVTTGTSRGTGLAVKCPLCGFVESFNTQLTSTDETSSDYTHSGEQARLIRQLMATPQVGLAASVLP